MQFGVFDHMDSAAIDIAQQFRDRLRLVEAYDRSGFYAYHLAEHHGTPLGLASSPSVFLAAVGERTQRLRFGPMVYTLSIYHPLRAIEEICMLDQLSGGRLELGMGRGISPIEMGFFDVGEESKAVYEEVSEIVLQSLSSDVINYAGKYYSFNNVPLVLKPVQTPHPPLWYGVANADRGAWAAARKMNIVTNGLASVVRVVTDRYKQEWSDSSHQVEPLPKIGMSRHVVIADSDAEAEKLAAPAYEKWFESLLHLWRAHNVQIPISFPEKLKDAMAEGHCVVGSLETVREKLAEEIERSGINYLLCRLAFGDLPVEQSLQSTACLQDEVIPDYLT
jgi:alkanesulfonate monooxygenase SsuD/methylene tetrahydromethanopterin reductase-like flavin-dependent oxidoreductase (luciferase family)